MKSKGYILFRILVLIITVVFAGISGASLVELVEDASLLGKIGAWIAYALLLFIIAVEYCLELSHDEKVEERMREIAREEIQKFESEKNKL